MKISVAMCTFDGERYIEAQIRSLLVQTRLPDEIVVRDDGSKDSTLSLVRQLLQGSGVAHSVEINPANLGSTRNFEGAIKACTGDVVCLCDQDDIWEARKLETIERILERSPTVSWVFSDGHFIDQDSRPLPGTLWERFGFDRSARRRFGMEDQLAPLLRRNFVTGCTSAFRTEALEGVFPFPEDWVHDQWLAMRWALQGKRGLAIEAPLIRYRLHEGQQVGGKVRTPAGELRSGRRIGANAFELEIERLRRLADVDGPKQNSSKALDDKIRHFMVRGSMRAMDFPRRVVVAMREFVAGRYKYSWSTMAVVRDLLGR